METDGGSFRIYTIGTEGPVLFFLHGGGYSGLTWAVLTVMNVGYYCNFFLTIAIFVERNDDEN